MRIFVRMLLALYFAWSLPAQAESCELHIWPSDQISAVDKDNSVTFLGDMMTVTSTLETVDSVGRSIAEAIGPRRQIELMRAFDFQSVPGLGRYKPIFHEGEVAPSEYAQQWLDKDFAEGKRRSSPNSDCYMELHVVFVTYLDQPAKDTLHTIFVMREFGDAFEARGIATGGGYHKSENIAWTDQVQSEEARQALALSFSENLRKFFERRKVKRLLRQLQ